MKECKVCGIDNCEQCIWLEAGVEECLKCGKETTLSYLDDEFVCAHDFIASCKDVDEVKGECDECYPGFGWNPQTGMCEECSIDSCDKCTL